MRREFYDLLAEVYEEKYSDTLNRKMRDEEKKLLLRYLKHGNVLDIGCGLGYHSKFLKKNNFNVYSLDISKNMILMGNVQNGIVAEATKLPFKSSFFDNIISIFGALNHANIVLFSKELERVLKDDGRFLITVANALCFKNILRLRVKKKGKIKIRIKGKTYSTNLRYYTPNDLKEVFRNFDIKIGSLYPKSIFLPFLRNFGYYLILYGKKI
ncbi:hypothetical protein DRN50_04825 [Thermococci archaeon]|nr:MAG: hypothetical protein DRN50_04825 [Thermococci archaeon]